MASPNFLDLADSPRPQLSPRSIAHSLPGVWGEALRAETEKVGGEPTDGWRAAVPELELLLPRGWQPPRSGSWVSPESWVKWQGGCC